MNVCSGSQTLWKPLLLIHHPFLFPHKKKKTVKALQTLKKTLGLPVRLGWNGDPCVPQQHPWSGADCQFDRTSSKWVIDGL